MPALFPLFGDPIMRDRNRTDNHVPLQVERLEDRLVLDAQSFVTGLYRDLLHRAPDMAGLNH
jgi:hypothetical protein